MACVLHGDRAAKAQAAHDAHADKSRHERLDGASRYAERAVAFAGATAFAEDRSSR
jgi:hypothetical protein